VRRVERKEILRLVLIVAFFAAMMLFAPALPDVFAQGGHQPPPADFEG